MISSPLNLITGQTKSQTSNNERLGIGITRLSLLCPVGDDAIHPAKSVGEGGGGVPDMCPNIVQYTLNMCPNIVQYTLNSNLYYMQECILSTMSNGSKSYFLSFQ